MKKQLLIAAVAATMTSVAFADVSITGAAQVNWTNTDTQNADSVNAISHDFDLKITGKSGATTIVMDIENTDASANLSQITQAEVDALAAAGGNVSATVESASAARAAVDGVVSNELNVKNVYMKTSIAGVNIKAGTWYGSDTLMSNGSQKTDQVSLDYSMSGVKVQYENEAKGDESVTVSGAVSGVSISHEMFQANDKTDTEVSGSFGGVNANYRSIESDATDADAKSFEVSTEVQGITLTYADVDADGTVSSDTFFGTHSAINEASGFGAATSIAGNTVTVKSYDIKTAAVNADDSYTKLVVNRALASGATLEVTYTDKDAQGTDADVETLDIELAVKF